MRVNYLGTVYGCRAAVPVMIAAGQRRDHQRLVDRRPSRAADRRRVRRHQGGADQPHRGAARRAARHRRPRLHACTRWAPRRSSATCRRASPATPRPKPFGPQQSARAVAEAIVRCAERPRPEVYPYWPSRAIVWLNAVAPGRRRLALRARRAQRRAGSSSSLPRPPAGTPTRPSGRSPRRGASAGSVTASSARARSS